MMTFTELWKNLMEEKIFIDDIVALKERFSDYAFNIVSKRVDPKDPELESFLKLCNDVYTYSAEGEVMIPDSLYDQCMQVYRSGGNSTIVYADTIGGKKWEFINHELPGMVGTVSKIYSYKELKDYLARYIGVNSYTLAPKYDGISCAIKIENGKIIYGATRYNGIKGQNITELVKRAKNSERFIYPELGNGFYKCELCVGTSDFNELVKLKKYANRRSATAGIINTPSNLRYAEFVTIIPLVFYNSKKKKMVYLAPYKKEVPFYSPSDLMDDIEEMLETIRSKDFEFRVDGVVINPDRSRLGDPNEFDLMDNSVAYKVNTMEGKTKIIYGYMSVGRLGRAIPMLKVEPVEVNETIVQDVNLGSYDKFLSMDLREGEEVVVYSAGDVIPQIKLPAVRSSLYNAQELKIPRVCPHCGEKLTRINTEYYCMNPDCPRVITGKISNFLIKMGIEGFSDKTVELIYDATHIKSIHKFLNLTVDHLIRIDGFESTSSLNLVNELERIKNTPVSVAKFFGALGIDKISEKKARKIFEYVNSDELLTAKDKKLDKIYWELQSSDGIGPKTAKVFIDYIKENRDEIIELLENDIRITGNIKYKYNIVFTGFRPDKETEKRINNLGIEVANSVSKSTLAVITASLDSSSGKSKAAVSKGIPVIHAVNLEDYLQEIEKNGF